ncbi:hypothetical protein GCM10011351_14650 [Paraliobacillus quinghaiensis]|uniref:Peptidase S11 D-alanyl-D-alanine carboxypeptidase A N-terminal domain-containing protein n=1 Tax=Paraliobacillus quinghaiensis TaxID=470815 RepID=A0A917TP26_9BACI|nr:D-alanyl-D-alanine carboxypeptidase family protein [Paraliobacillus quinghaiensis]GGM29605.1 hypothetical protein GCM10011351_14650 [Paraliobacillus quinghaiensis]
MNKFLVFSLSIVLFIQFNIPKVEAQQEVVLPNILSESAILIDATTGEVLLEKKPKKVMYPASLTKVATAIYAIERGNLDDIVTVSQNSNGTGGSSVYLEEGEQVKLKTLIQGLLVNSGNDAGVAIAEHLDGSVEKFSSNINQYLKNTIGINTTNFMNPHGLFDPKHTTTASDLAKITQYAMQNGIFKDIFGMKQLEWNGLSWNTTLYTHHKLMREVPYDGINGGKTGYVNESGFTLITTAERENISLIAVVLKGSQPTAYNDTTKLLDYGFKNFETSKIAKGKEYVNVLGERYEVPNDLFFTNRIGEEIVPDILTNGKLVINQQKSKFNSTFELKKKIEEVEEIQPELLVEETVAESDNDGNFLIKLIKKVISYIFNLGEKVESVLNS